MLTLRSLPLRSARYHWRANLPVLLGVAVGAAVLAGSLLVGDSLRGSLRDRALRQLNGVEAAVVGPHMVRQQVATELGEGVVPALLLQGSVRTDAVADGRRLGRAAVIGFDAAGATAFGLPAEIDWSGDAARVVLSHRAATALGATAGSTLLLGVEKGSAVPRSSLLGRRGADDVTASLRATVAAVLPADHPLNDFALAPNPAPPANVFVPLRFLQAGLDRAGRVNALLARSGDADDLSRRLAGSLTLDDWDIRVDPKPRGYVSVESGQLVLNPATAAAVGRAAEAVGGRSEPTAVYLANAITPGTEPLWNKDAGDPTGLIPYSTVASVNPTAAPPLGPFLPPGVTALADDQIALTDWPASPLKALKPGDRVTLTFFKPEMEAAVEETSATFRFAGFAPMAGPAGDPGLTPPFPGITDKLKISEWDSPFEINNRRIRPRDEAYWEKHRAAPKAYITLAAGERLFGSRFGSVTSVRVASPAGLTTEQTADKLRPELLRQLDPAATGLRFEPARDRLLAASKGGTDFGMLFLGFSFFLIASALLLVGLLFRLAIDRRAKEVGLLLAAGYSPGRVVRLLLLEGTAVAAAGAFLGLAAAVLFARLMLAVLVDLWPDPEVGRFLRLHVGPGSLAAGVVGTLAMAAVTVWLSVRGLVKVPAPALLRGATATGETTTAAGRSWRSFGVAAVAAVVGGGLLAAGGGVQNPDARAGSFFGGGSLLLLAGLLLARAWLKRPRTSPARSATALGVRNAARNPARSLLTAALIASATFLLVAVESFRRRPDADFLDKTGGSGGYNLLAEADVPIFRPFDRGDGKDDLLERLRAVYQTAEARDPAGPSRADRLVRAEKLLKDVNAVPLRVRSGDDASCLNLYQAGRPRVLGVPDELIRRGGFRFAQTEAETPEEKANPWLLLTKPRGDGAVPVFVEQNSAMWMLKTGVGGELTQPDGDGNPVRLRIVGTLQDSVFQSELLMADAAFRRLYPREEGFSAFLLSAPPESATDVAALLETGFAANGLTVTPSRDRVAAYQAVVGTYLTTFQLLGGFGLLLGVLGLGVVVLRAVWERVGELALLRAVGYRTRTLQGMMLAETAIVLLIGLGIGLIAAAASVAPHLALGGSPPGPRLAALLALVATTGLAVAAVATSGVARVPLVPALRKE